MMIQQPQWRRKAQIAITAAACLLLCILILRQHIQHATHSIPHLNSKETSSRLPPGGQQSPHHKPSQTTCHDLPGASSVFVVLKTGATESQIKLPVHLATTLRCTPHYAIYSDLDEDIATVPIYDVFAGVPDSLKSTSPDFAFYHLQHAWRRAGLNISAIALASSDMRSAAWTLDKWKFLPLMLRALADAPPATPWFLFIEADTSIVWTNTLRWLQRLDARQALYVGGQNWLAGDIFPFGHGGTGVVLSRPALVRLAGMLSAEPDVYERLTAASWAGDYVLARALREVGVLLTPAWPILQGETPWRLEYTEALWCWPVVSWHHMGQDWIRRIWEFEQVFSGGQGIYSAYDEGVEDEEDQAGGRRVMRHYHIFEHFVAPHVLRVRERKNWDNMSPTVVLEGEDGMLVTDLDGCRRVCEEKDECMQWQWIGDGTCRIGTAVRLGEKVDEVEGEGIWMTSGWMGERVERFVEEMRGCKEDWILP